MASRWAKGCGIGCAGCAIAALAVVTLVVTLAPGVVDQVRSAVDRQRWFDQWKGPRPDAPIDEVLPPHAEELSRGDATSGPGPELLAFDGNTMLHATYRGDRTIEVWATRATAEERDAYFERASSVVDRSGSGLTASSLIGHVLTLRYGRPSTSVALWWADDWLFVFVARDGEPLRRFPDELLRLVERPGNGAS